LNKSENPPSLLLPENVIQPDVKHQGAKHEDPEYLDYIEGMWHPIKTVGLAEYLAAEGGPNWYQQLAKSKLGTPDIEFNRINKYEFEFTIKISIIFAKTFPFYLDRSFAQDSILGDVVVTHPTIKRKYLDFKITGSRAGLTRNKLEVRNRDLLILTSTLVDKNNTSFKRTFERIPSEPNK